MQQLCRVRWQWLPALVFLLALVLSPGLQAADDAYHSWLRSHLQSTYGLSGGTWLLPDTEVATINNRAAGTGESVVTVGGQNFTQAVRVTRTAPARKFWEGASKMFTTGPITAGNRLLVAVWVRSVSASIESGMMTLVFQQSGGSYTKLVAKDVPLTTTWKLWLLPCEAPATYASGGARFEAWAGHQTQTVEFGGVAVLNYGTAYTLAQLPQTEVPLTYAGLGDPAASWRTAANSRIDTHRKANLNVTVRDLRGQPVAGAAVEARMGKHAFEFGSALNESLVTGTTTAAATYRDKFLNMGGSGKGLNAGLAENGLKWTSWEGDYTPVYPQQRTVDTNDWLWTRGLKTKGHTLIWGESYLVPQPVKDLSGNRTAFINAVNAHIDDEAGDPRLVGRLNRWDVVNEPYQSDLLITWLSAGGYTEDSIYRDVYSQWFNRVRSIDAVPKLFINDEGFLTNAGLNQSVHFFHKRMIELIQQGGATVDGLGMQCHFSTRMPLPKPATVLQVLDYFGNAFPGKEIQISEYDSVLDSEANEAAFLDDFLTLTFSHPSVSGFYMWGFWSGSQWRGKAPVYRTDWTVSPSGQKFISKVFSDWWTTAQGSTNGQGNYSVRGFKGDYAVTATHKGNQFQVPVTLVADASPEIRMLNYAPGFVWKRSLGWDAAAGNPDRDSLGNAVWSYESTVGFGGSLGSGNEWFKLPTSPLSNYSTADGAWRPLTSTSFPTASSASLFEYRWAQSYIQGAPVAKWSNPTARSLNLAISGTLKLTWDGSTANRVLDVAIVQRDAVSGTLALLFSGSRSRPAGASPQVVNLPVSLTSLVKPKDQIWVTFSSRQGAQSYYQSLADDLTFSLTSFASAAAETIVDNVSAVQSPANSWTLSTSVPGYYGSNYAHDGNTGKGKTMTFAPNLEGGVYELYGRWSADGTRANNVPFTVNHRGGVSTLAVNQQVASGSWARLGGNAVYEFNPGSNGSVVIGTAATSGFVIADAIRWVKVGELSPNQAPVAVNDAASTNEGVAVNINVLGNDSDADNGPGGLSIQSVGAAANGTVAIVSGSVRYTPNAGFYGADGFSYVISDGAATAGGTVSVTVNSTALANNLLGTGAALSGTNIGTNSGGGSRVLADGSWEVNGSGGGLGGSADSFRFESKSVSGDFEVVARVNSLTSGGTAPLAGIMIRESNAVGSRMVALATTTGTGATAYRRVTRTTADTAATTTNLSANYTYANGWVGLVRTGTNVEVFTSGNGTAWTSQGIVGLVGLGGSVQVGVFGSSGSVGVNARAVITDFEINPLNSSGGSALGIDFQGSSTAMGAGETAGVVSQANWNTAAAASGTATGLKDDSGATTSAGLTWISNGVSGSGVPDTAGNNRMMSGYLDTNSTSTTTVSVSGLPAAITAHGYDVYVYFDGHNPTANRQGNYTISGTTVAGQDAAGATFSGTFVQAGGGGNGNYVKFTNLSGAGFVLTGSGGIASDGVKRAPINGLQIVARPPAFSLNFSAGGTAMAPGESAGVINKTNWNNAAAASGTLTSLSSDGGLVFGSGVVWNSAGVSGSGLADAAGNNRMMRGYLDTTNSSVTTVSFSGLPLALQNAGYDVFVYFDGYNTSNNRQGVYTIGGTTVTGQDAAGTTFGGTFVEASGGSNGNYVKFSNLNGAGFLLSGSGGAASDGTKRAPINAIQIIPRP